MHHDRHLDKYHAADGELRMNNQCLDRIIGERVKSWIADAAVADACATANPNPDVD